MTMNRRTFAKTSSMGLFSGLVTAQSPGKAVLGANDRIRCAFVGLGNMGRGDLRDFLKCPNVEAAAVCDVWQANVDRAIQITDGKATGYNDFRRVIERKDIDVVVVATPDHWHAYIAIQACQAGKDVYVEKPLAYNIHEGRRIVDAARKYDRVVQVGTQQRSGRHFQQAVAAIQSGKIGNISRVAAWNVGNESPYGMTDFPDSDPPADLNYDMWLGPAPKRPFNANRFIFNFRYFWDYAGGYATDWGVHHIDVVQWAMNVRAPKRVSALGGKYYIKDNRDTPDTLEVIYEYPKFLLTYSNRILNGNPMLGRSWAIAFYGTDATLVVDRAGYDILPETHGTFEPLEPFYKRELQSTKTGRSFPPWGSDRNVWTGRSAELHSDGDFELHLAHVKNFVDCVKSRKRPASDVEIGHYSTSTTHLANIAYRTGRTVQWNSDSERIENDTEAAAYLSRNNREPWLVT
jgi:predicted dehydrogenase